MARGEQTKSPHQRLWTLRLTFCLLSSARFVRIEDQVQEEGWASFATTDGGRCPDRHGHSPACDAGADEDVRAADTATKEKHTAAVG